MEGPKIFFPGIRILFTVCLLKAKIFSKRKEKFVLASYVIISRMLIYIVLELNLNIENRKPDSQSLKQNGSFVLICVRTRCSAPFMCQFCYLSGSPAAETGMACVMERDVLRQSDPPLRYLDRYVQKMRQAQSRHRHSLPGVIRVMAPLICPVRQHQSPLARSVFTRRDPSDKNDVKTERRERNRSGGEELTIEHNRREVRLVSNQSHSANGKVSPERNTQEKITL